MQRTLLIAVCLGGGWLTWTSGYRGVYLLDQSMIFDGAWRILQGQTPYRDFFMPFGPVAFWLQAAFSALLGMNWTSMVWSAVVVHTAATLLAYQCTLRLLDNRPSIGPLISAAMTAATFQSLFGTLWIEQTAFLLNYGSLWLLLESQESTCRYPRVVAAAAGVCAILSLLTKQNAMVLFVPVLMCVWLRRPPLSGHAAGFVVGAVLSLSVFSVWLQASGGFEGWCRHFVEIPCDIARARSGNEGWKRLGDQLSGRTTAVPVVLAIAASGLSLSLRSPWRVWPAVLFSVMITFFRIVFQVSTANESANTVSQLAMGIGVGCGLIALLIREADAGSMVRRFEIPRLHVAGSLLITGFLCWKGVSASLAKPIQQFIPSTTFWEESRSPGMEGVKWGNPTQMSDYSNLTLSEWDGLVEQVRKQKRSFLVWGDATLLYGLAQQPSVSPLLYLGRNHSYRLKDGTVLDTLLLAALRRQGVTMIVKQTRNAIEKNVNQLQDFPQSYRWVQENFQLAQQSEHFEIYLPRDEKRLWDSQP